MDAPALAAQLTPQPQELTLGEGHLALGNGPRPMQLPDGPEHEACRMVLKTTLDGDWVSTEPGWQPRASSPTVEPSTTYHIRAEITRNTWRVIVQEPEASPWQPAFWDSGRIPMDPLEQTCILFADVEPENSKGASRWGPIRIYRER